MWKPMSIMSDAPNAGKWEITGRKTLVPICHRCGVGASDMIDIAETLAFYLLTMTIWKKTQDSLTKLQKSIGPKIRKKTFNAELGIQTGSKQTYLAELNEMKN